MTILVFIDVDGNETRVDATDGDTIMETAVDHDVEGIEAECGGEMMCATCHSYIDQEFLDRLPPRTEEENEMLECTAAERNERSRLTCQIIVDPEIDGVRIFLPESQY